MREGSGVVARTIPSDAGSCVFQKGVLTLEELIRNGRNEIVGRLNTSADGSQVALDANLNILGFYNAQSNTTADRNGNFIGFGNLIQRMFPY